MHVLYARIYACFISRHNPALNAKKNKKTIMMNSNVMAHFFKRISSDSRLAKDAALRMPNRFEREGNIMINDSNVM